MLLALSLGPVVDTIEVYSTLDSYVKLEASLLSTCPHEVSAITRPHAECGVSQVRPSSPYQYALPSPRIPCLLSPLYPREVYYIHVPISIHSHEHSTHSSFIRQQPRSLIIPNPTPTPLPFHSFTPSIPIPLPAPLPALPPHILKPHRHPQQNPLQRPRNQVQPPSAPPLPAQPPRQTPRPHKTARCLDTHCGDGQAADGFEAPGCPDLGQELDAGEDGGKDAEDVGVGLEVRGEVGCEEEGEEECGEEVEEGEEGGEEGGAVGWGWGGGC